MKPQEWIKCVREAAEQLENLEFLQEGTTHLAAALEEIDRLRATVERLTAENASLEVENRTLRGLVRRMKEVLL